LIPQNGSFSDTFRFFLEPLRRAAVQAFQLLDRAGYKLPRDYRTGAAVKNVRYFRITFATLVLALEFKSAAVPFARVYFSPRQ